MINILNSSNPASLQFQDIPEELKNSSAKILAFADMPREKVNAFKFNMEIFIKTKDKSAAIPVTRQVCEQLTAIYYETYMAVLKRITPEDKKNHLLQMFLRFGYMDERLLTTQQCITLYKLVESEQPSSAFSVYHLPDWFEMICCRVKEPSVNEFGQDYYDVFLEKKKRGEISDNDKAFYDHDIDGRLAHEFDNLFKMGQRLTSGQMGSYCPILHQDLITRDLENSLVTPAKLEASLNKVLAVDYSAFHREVVFTHNTKTLAPELIMKSVLPELILLPGLGQRNVMWQILSGKSKCSSGRFIFPVFTEENLDNLMVDAVARFRWDLSRNMSGTVINKANEISLYLDYSDYIQFYAKNRDLSGEVKDKLKTAIKRHRNNARELFARDYHTWINYESKSLLRLNKVAREILFKHCPFSKTVRDHLLSSPVYNPIISNFNNSRLKQCRILESRYSKLASSPSCLDPDLQENLLYFNG